MVRDEFVRRAWEILQSFGSPLAGLVVGAMLPIPWIVGLTVSALIFYLGLLCGQKVKNFVPLYLITGLGNYNCSLIGALTIRWRLIWSFLHSLWVS